MIRALFYRIASFICVVSTALPAQAQPIRSGLNALPKNAGKNMLLVVLDDVGSEHLEFMPQAVTPIPTPTITSLAAQGLLYDNFWAAPNCSPARSMMLTGRYTLRTGVGNIVKRTDPYILPLSEVTVAEKMQARGYRTGMFGKWHLGNDPELPCQQGFDVWMGTLGNISPLTCTGSCSFYDWKRYDDTPATTAVLSSETAYATTVVTDEAMAFVQQPGAWFAYVAYHDAHKPWEAPPGYSGPMDDLSIYRAKIQFLDAEVARLMSVVDLAETTVIVVSDNGAPKNVTVPPNSAQKSKFTVYRGGVEMPCIIVGFAVDRAIGQGQNTAGQVLSGNAHIVDLYRTILQLQPKIGPGSPTGQPQPVDSTTLYKKGVGFRDDVRDWSFVERFAPNGTPPNGPYTVLDRAIEQNDYKLILPDLGAPLELYQTDVDPWELFDLLADGIDPAEQAIIDSLEALLFSELGLQ